MIVRNIAITLNYLNDSGLKEVFVDYEVGGVERQKVIFLLI